MSRIRLLAFALLPALGLAAPAHAQKAPVEDASIECGAFFQIMSSQAEEGSADAELFSTMANIMFNHADGKLEAMRVSEEERARIGGEAVEDMSGRIDSGELGFTFTQCHATLEAGFDDAFPDLLEGDNRELLACGAQFLFMVQSGEVDKEDAGDFEVAAESHLERVAESLRGNGYDEDDLEFVSNLYGLSVGMILGMEEDPLVPWERCGEI
jgi:hypothetical protein